MSSWWWGQCYTDHMIRSRILDPSEVIGSHDVIRDPSRNADLDPGSGPTILKLMIRIRIRFRVTLILRSRSGSGSAGSSLLRSGYGFEYRSQLENLTE